MFDRMQVVYRSFFVSPKCFLYRADLFFDSLEYLKLKKLWRLFDFSDIASKEVQFLRFDEPRKTKFRGQSVII